MTYELETKQLPPGRPGTLSATIRQMHVGQSFLIPDTDIKDKKKTQSTVHTIAATLDNVKLSTRSEDGGLRVYRVPYEQTEARAEIVEDVDIETGEIPAENNEKLGLADLKTLMSAIDEKHTTPRNLSDDPDVMWVDAGEHWNEIQGEMVAMERHVKTGKFREKV